MRDDGAAKRYFFRKAFADSERRKHSLYPFRGLKAPPVPPQAKADVAFPEDTEQALERLASELERVTGLALAGSDVSMARSALLAEADHCIALSKKCLMVARGIAMGRVFAIGPMALGLSATDLRELADEDPEIAGLLRAVDEMKYVRALIADSLPGSRRHLN